MKEYLKMQLHNTKHVLKAYPVNFKTLIHRSRLEAQIDLLESVLNYYNHVSEQKRQLLVEQFKEEEFMKRYYNDSVFRQCFESLLRNQSPYEIIEHLIKEREILIQKIQS